MVPSQPAPLPTRFAPAERAEDAELKLQAEQSLGHPLTKAILESVSGFAFVLNQQRQILAANPESMEALGLNDPAEVRGWRPGELFRCIHAQEQPGGCGTSEACAYCGAVLTILAAQTTGAPATGECLLTVDRDGVATAGEFRVRCSPVCLGGRDVLLFLLQDISGQKRREALEHIFFHDVLRLAGGLSGSARKLLLEPERVPVTARQIQGLSEQLSREVVAQRILLSAEEGTLLPEPVDVEVEDLLVDLCARFASQEEGQGRRLRFDVGNGGTMHVDGVLLRIVLTNLVKNALEAIPEGGEAVVRHVVKGQERRFVVQNPGVIPADVVPRIFQRSFSTKAVRGRGLGTYGARLLAEKYLGGSLDFLSDPERGTRFTLHLPVELQAPRPRRATVPEETHPLKSSEQALSTILVVDDSPVERQILASVLAREHRVLQASCGEEGLALAQEFLPDVILLDAVMPGQDGFTVCTKLKAQPRTADIPVLFVSTLNSETDETLALEAGAIDVIMKPIRPLVVAARVRNHLELKRSRDSLRALSLLDGLTGIANRRRFDQQFEADWRHCARGKRPLALILGDVDFFKRYNDAYGHLPGDDCLKAVAAAFQGALQRPGDLAARYGGEEFVGILRDTDLKGALGVAERIRAAVSALGLPHAFSAVAPIVTLSLGVAACVPQDPAGWPTFLKKVDEKLYEAKNGGRNRVCS